MKRGRLAVFAVFPAMALSALVLWGGSRDGTTASAQQDLGHSQIEVSKARPWSIVCDADSCGGGELVGIPVRTPPSVARVDVVLTVAVDAKVSRDDKGLADAYYSPRGNPPFKALAPGLFPFSSSHGVPTTISFQWISRNIEANGNRYVFGFAVDARDESGDGRVTVLGKKISAVLTVWPAGP